MRISDAGGQTVANDLMTMFSSVDGALLDAARLAVSIMETNAASTIPPARLQPALDSAAAGFLKFVEGRKDMAQMHRKLVLIKGESNHAETNWGCWREDGLIDVIFGENSSAATAQASV